MKQNFNFTIDPEIKQEAQEILEANGQKMSSVIELYFKDIIKHNKGDFS